MQQSEYINLVKIGYLPYMELHTVDEYKIDFIPNPKEIDRDKINKGLESLKEDPDDIKRILLYAEQSMAFIEKNYGNDFENYPGAELINTNYKDFEENNDNLILNAVFIKPFVTYLDKIIYNVILIMYCDIHYAKRGAESELYEYVFADFLLKIQDFENTTKKTFDLYKLINSKHFNAIFFDHNFDIDADLLFSINEDETTRLSSLIDKRRSIKEKLSKNRITAKEFVEKEDQKKNWEDFVTVINELAKKEKVSFSAITNTTLNSNEKRAQLKSYVDCVEGIITKGNLKIDNRTIDLSVLQKDIEARFNNSRNYCYLSTNKKDSFCIDEQLLSYLEFPNTFNYLLITYHLFRLDPNRSNARIVIRSIEGTIKGFLELNGCLNRLSDNFAKITDIIEDIYLLVQDFYNCNKNMIEQMSFDSIYKNGTPIGSMQSALLMDQVYEQMIYEYDEQVCKIANNINQENIDSMIDEIFSDNSEFCSNLILENKKEAKRIEESETAKRRILVAKQLISCLDPIFMLSQIIQILISKNVDGLRGDYKLYDIGTRLSDLQERICYKVYSLNVNIPKHRIENSLDYNYIQNIEIKNDEKAHSIYSEDFLKMIGDLFETIGDCDVDKTMELFSKVKMLHSTNTFLNENERTKIEKWIDVQNTMVFNHLTEICKTKENDFSIKTESVKTIIGPKNAILSNRVIDTLATAEMLFDTYGIQKYIDSGFDYSCISSLYYQAVEASYNEKIWKGYANILNTIPSNQNTCIADIIERQCYQFGRRQISNIDSFAQGYVNLNDINNRFKYIKYDRNLGCNFAVENCMISNFSDLMADVCNNEPINHFYDYLSNTLGYDSSIEMLSDNYFMSNCRKYANDLKDSVGRRNNASHGGCPIDFNTCKEDRERVLIFLEETRNNSICLIKELLDLFCKQ